MHAAAGRTILDNAGAEMPQCHSMFVDRAGGNYGANLSRQPYMPGKTTIDIDMSFQHMPAGHIHHLGMDRCMMLLLNAQQH